MFLLIKYLNGLGLLRSLSCAISNLYYSGHW